MSTISIMDEPAGKGNAMANASQLAILKKGVGVWNKWRIENSKVNVDLTNADLKGAYLKEVHFNGAKLNGSDLREANLIQADLSASDLSYANLFQARLSYVQLNAAKLIETDFGETDLRGADLTEANLWRADFTEANLFQANLSRVTLEGADLRGANLCGAIVVEGNFAEATVGRTIFGYSDLSEALGLDELFHASPSSLATDLFIHTKGNIPEAFLQGCGLSDWEIHQVKLYRPDLSNDEVNKILYRMYDLRASQALQISPLFISYSHSDKTFVDKLENHLNKNGIRFWRDIHDTNAGRLEKQIDRAVHQNPTVLLVLSSNSIKSDWVEHEVRIARGLEKEVGRDMLCPIALDDSWKSSPWPKRIMEQIMEYNILDFSPWQDDGKFDIMFRKLITGLELFYKG